MATTDFQRARAPEQVEQRRAALLAAAADLLDEGGLAAVDRFLAMLQAAALVDVMRIAYPEPEKLYTWWSYRARDWATSNRGRRLDHILASPGIGARMRDITILSDARGWEKPSDHVPVVATIA